MALSLAALRILLGTFFALTGAAKLSPIAAPVSQQMVSGVRPRASPVRALRRGVPIEGVRLPARPCELPDSSGLAGAAGRLAAARGPTAAATHQYHVPDFTHDGGHFHFGVSERIPEHLHPGYRLPVAPAAAGCVPALSPN